MPVFMERAKWSNWLDPKNREIEGLIALMQNPDPAAGLVTRPVSSRVNLVANNGPELIAEIELGEAQTLF
jgi:putative SOS response-associated peptidase YedK